MIKRYGVPYQGSKNATAKKIIDFLPPAKNFYDLFAGGCAITHAALESGKWENYFCNDINPAPTQLFIDAVNGKYSEEKRWISREEFFALKEKEAYIKYCWSFSNNGRDYLYGEHIEPWKKALHFALVFKDFSLLEEMNLEFNKYERKNLRCAIFKRQNECREKYCIFFQKALDTNNQNRKSHLSGSGTLESLERTLHLERLQSLQRLTLSYEQVEIKPDSILYCDIPYKGTTGFNDDKKNVNFYYEKFYSWAEQQTELVFISEYSMP